MHIYADILNEILRKSKYFGSSAAFLRLTAMITTKSSHTSPDLDGDDPFSSSKSWKHIKERLKAVPLLWLIVYKGLKICTLMSAMEVLYFSLYVSCERSKKEMSP